MGQPAYINYDQLTELLGQETPILIDRELEWWNAHRVQPFAAQYHKDPEVWHYVVAVSGSAVILFADDEDEFGTGTITGTEPVITTYGLVGNLLDTVRNVLIHHERRMD